MLSVLPRSRILGPRVGQRLAVALSFRKSTIISPPAPPEEQEPSETTPEAGTSASATAAKPSRPRKRVRTYRSVQLYSVDDGSLFRIVAIPKSDRGHTGTNKVGKDPCIKNLSWVRENDTVQANGTEGYGNQITQKQVRCAVVSV